MDEPCIYEICVEGHLSENWSEWFDGLRIHNQADGETVLSGTFVDQAALFGTLTKVHSLNLTLISVNRKPAL
jgi:hypothetical protein